MIFIIILYMYIFTIIGCVVVGEVRSAWVQLLKTATLHELGSC
jgi:hypothetical protein